ncbi:zinc ribbon domain-containing protein [Natrarchaeobius sp. A-rgal3]|uniref:zinc ribbon domain-containing protein n=1 Tax=Natrarchaeobius versutus TaxID=1679078 RepID=UPI00350FDCA8
MTDDEDDRWGVTENGESEEESATDDAGEPAWGGDSTSSDAVDSGDDAGWPPRTDENDRDDSGFAGTDSVDGGESEPRADAAVGASDDSRPRPDEQYCSSCGEIIEKEARICPHCGVERRKSAGSQEKDPTIAALLSAIGLFFPLAAGAGQLYNGQVGKGLAFCLIQFFNAMLIILLIGFITFPLVGIYTIYDAHQTATKINRGEITV